MAATRHPARRAGRAERYLQEGAEYTLSTLDNQDETSDEDAQMIERLDFANRHGSKTVAGEACFYMALLYQRRATRAAKFIVLGVGAPLAWIEQWKDAMYNADKHYRNALRKGHTQSARALCHLHMARKSARRACPSVVEELEAGHNEHEPRAGDRVRLRGLSSDEGRRLNGQMGTIVKYIEPTDRYGISIDCAESLKYIKAENLIFIGFEDDYGGP